MPQPSDADAGRDTAAMRVVFWTWAAVIGGGLAFMVVIALSGA